MHVAIDVSPAVHGRAGLGRYAYELTAALVRLDPENRYTVFYNDPGRAKVMPPLDTLPRLVTPLSNKPWRMSVLMCHVTRRCQDALLPGMDIFHATDHLLPYFGKVASVFTLHDLTPIFYPATHTRWNRWFLKLMMPRFVHHADVVIADSESTRQDARRLYKIDQKKIHLVYPGVSPRFRPVSRLAVAAVREKYRLPERFLLYVGTIEPRKNLGTLLDAYATLRTRRVDGVHLVIAGRTGWLARSFFQKLQSLQLHEQVSLPGFIEDADLPALYTAAQAFVYPSVYEGFGLPVLEAMACGTPVVCSDTSSLPEISGDAAIRVSPKDTPALADALEQVLTDTDTRARLSAAGLAQAQRFTWENTARQTLDIYRQLHKIRITA